MSEDAERQLLAGKARAGTYTTKDFQLEVLGQLAEMREVARELREELANEAKKNSEAWEPRRLLRFDGRTLVAIGAIALSMTGYVLQDARNSTKRDAEIESATARITNLEKVEAANTEGRIKTEVELGELREGEAEIKALIEAHDSASRGAHPQKSGGRGLQ
jgi:soluble cytochrome b562